MPMGLRNAPAIHQCRVNKALRHYLGKFCHIYLDDIIIWSNTIEEHRAHTCMILKALQDAGLYCNLKKTKLFQQEVHFLGHIISQKGISPDDKKVKRIINWPVPSCTKEVHGFLGLVWYLAAFLLQLAKHTQILNKLTEKDCDYNFPEWNPSHQAAFQGIKDLVLSADCLTVIDYNLMTTEDCRVFVTADTSDTRSGAMLSFGKTWESARPVAFESKPFKHAELNYPVHKKELYAIVWALAKWHSNLLGVPFMVLTDHRTLECFQLQKHLSRRQAHWMEQLQQYNFDIVYIKGQQNSVADTLSWTNFKETLKEIDTWCHESFDRLDELDIPVCSLLEMESVSPWELVQNLARCPRQRHEVANTIMEISVHDELCKAITEGYQMDSWCRKALEVKMDDFS
jgi:hypothetical protein